MNNQNFDPSIRKVLDSVRNARQLLSETFAMKDNADPAERMKEIRNAGIPVKTK